TIMPRTSVRGIMVFYEKLPFQSEIFIRKISDWKGNVMLFNNFPHTKVCGYDFIFFADTYGLDKLFCN
ncbi:MAG: hypothetical protein M0Q94_04655, partial [Candidatus Cloacimonetes bacterium]|nr:hypothetical protein [Candidatus Cloacimonadota bacterium]